MADRSIADAWESGDPYESYVGRWSRRVAPLFLAWLSIGEQRRWLDVGCGTGALSAAILEHCSPSALIGVEPSAGFLGKAKRELGDRVLFYQGSAERIPIADQSVDGTVSGLVLNFVPQPSAALAEMIRVTAVGGTLAAYVWDYAGGMELMRHFWSAAAELDPGAASLDEGTRFPICRPEPLEDLFSSAGLRDPAVAPIDIATTFASFDDYWAPFLGGQGPAPAYAMSLDESTRTQLRESLRKRLPVRTDGTIALTARAWAVRGAVAS